MAVHCHLLAERFFVVDLQRFAMCVCHSLTSHGFLQGASGAELKASCTEAGMFALRERRIHVTQEDFEMAVAKVMKKDSDKNMSLKKLWK